MVVTTITEGNSTKIKFKWKMLPGLTAISVFILRQMILGSLPERFGCHSISLLYKNGFQVMEDHVKCIPMILFKTQVCSIEFRNKSVASHFLLSDYIM